MKGYVETSLVLDVAALKNVVFPVFVFPTIPIRINFWPSEFWMVPLLALSCPGGKVERIIPTVECSSVGREDRAVPLRMRS